MHQIQKLTGLTSLNLSWTEIERDALTCLTRLTNLRSLDITGLSLREFDWEILTLLPNLRTLKTNHFKNKSDNNALTNLHELILSGNAWNEYELNLAMLTNLTRLAYVNHHTISKISFPPYLKKLVVDDSSSRYPKPAEYFDDLFNLASLESLAFNSPRKQDLQTLPPGLTRLTKLRKFKKHSLSTGKTLATFQ